MKILWITNIPSPYRVDFFNRLGELCDLTVLFERENAKNRNESWKQFNTHNFQGVILNGINVTDETSLCFRVIKYLKKNVYDHVIVSNPLTPTGILAIEFLKLRNIPYIVEGDGGFAKNGKGFKEKFKTHIMKGASLYFSTSKEHDNYYLNYGAKKRQIKRYPFTSINKTEVIPNTIKEEEKTLLREKLGIKEKRILLSVGQFIHRKGFDILLKATKDFKDDIGVYIIGGTPTQEYKKLVKELNLTNVYFIEFQNKEKLKSFYRAADLFVLPTRHEAWGLVINEAMANGLPIITTNKCIAGLELIENGVNGYLIPSDDVKELRNKINRLLDDSDLLKSMSNKSIKKISHYTIENMAETHINIIRELK